MIFQLHRLAWRFVLLSAPTLALMTTPATAQQFIELGKPSQFETLDMPEWAVETCQGRVEKLADADPAVKFYPLAWEGADKPSGVLVYKLNEAESQSLYVVNVGTDKASCHRRPGAWNPDSREVTFIFGSSKDRKLVLNVTTGAASFFKLRSGQWEQTASATRAAAGRWD